MNSESDSLHARVRAFIDASMRGAPGEPFDALATDVARFQMKHVAPLRRLAGARGIAGESLSLADQIPAVPTDVFRFARVAAHRSEDDVAVFRTSGTTSGPRGVHAFRTLATYDAAAMAWGARFLLATVGASPHSAPPSTTGAHHGAPTSAPRSPHSAPPGAPRSRQSAPPSTTGAHQSAPTSTTGAHHGTPTSTTRAHPKEEHADICTDSTVISLTPPPAEATDSSLLHMIALFRRSQTGPVSFHLDGGALDPRTVEAACARARKRGRPALLFGTSFAFVHLLDGAKGLPLTLPPGSRAMLTGGFKGRSRDVPEGELRAAIAAAFGVPDAAVVGEYGMTELSSQLYEGTLVGTHTHHGVYTAPPWVRVKAVDPATLDPLPDGEIGIARIVDLANVDSAVAVQTADRVRVTGADVELFGRLPGASPRGCSLAVEEMLG